MAKYTVTLTEPQVRVVQLALEEYFRLRMGQSMDFCDDLAGVSHDLSPDNPNYKEIFNRYIQRRDHLQELMLAFYRIAFEPFGYLDHKTEDMMIAECIWDTIRCARGLGRYQKPWQIGPEPIPEIKAVEGGKEKA